MKTPPRSLFARGVRASLAAALLLVAATARAEFREDFDAPLVLDPSGEHGWTYRTGDGTATMLLAGHDGMGTIQVDATNDRRGIWWAFIRREVTSDIDLARVAQPHTELRVEARVRSSHAPRRINLHLNTQRTTDFHGNLMEFDLPKAEEWQTVSMTTRDFDGRPGDRLFVQLALMDWGLGKYRVDVDYLRVEIVDPRTATPDLGGGVPYHPTPPTPESLVHALPVVQAATVDAREPDANLADWAVIEQGKPTPILTVNGSQYAVLRWDLRAFAGRKAKGGGLLELRTHSVQRPAERRKDFGMIRVVEILGGDPEWRRETVSYDSLCQGHAYDSVFNTQMIIDVEVNDAPGGSTFATLTEAVVQRLIDGRTKGIVLIPLGSINAAFLPGQPGAAGSGPVLRFNVAE